MSKPNAVPLNQLYSMRFPELKNFRELYKPIVSSHFNCFSVPGALRL